jgi:hypothetical protein
MMEECVPHPVTTCCEPMLLQCSVEPTAAVVAPRECPVFCSGQGSAVQQTVILVRGASQGAEDGDVHVVQKSVVSVGNGNDDLGQQLHTVEAHYLGGG